MSCDDFRESLAARALGIAPGEGAKEAGELEAHLASCPACREEKLALEATRRALPELVAARAPALSPDVRAKVLAGIREREPRRASWKRPLLGVAFLAAASLAVLLVPTAPSPLPSPPVQTFEADESTARSSSRESLPLDWRTTTVASVASSQDLAAALATFDASRPDLLDRLELANTITHEEKVLLVQRIEAAPVTSARLALVAEEIRKLRVARAKEAAPVVPVGK